MNTDYFLMHHEKRKTKNEKSQICDCNEPEPKSKNFITTPYLFIPSSFVSAYSNMLEQIVDSSALLNTCIIVLDLIFLRNIVALLSDLQQHFFPFRFQGFNSNMYVLFRIQN